MVVIKCYWLGLDFELIKSLVWYFFHGDSLWNWCFVWWSWWCNARPSDPIGGCDATKGGGDPMSKDRPSRGAPEKWDDDAQKNGIFLGWLETPKKTTCGFLLFDVFEMFWTRLLFKGSCWKDRQESSARLCHGNSWNTGNFDLFYFLARVGFVVSCYDGFGEIVCLTVLFHFLRAILFRNLVVVTVDRIS